MMTPQQQRVYDLCIADHEAMMRQYDGFGSAYRRGFAGGNRLYPASSLAHAAWKAGHDNKRKLTPAQRTVSLR